MCCIEEDTIGVKTLLYQNQLLLLKTTYRYHCDVIVRDHPTDLGLCYSDVTLQQPQNASFNVSLESFCWSSSVLLLLLTVMSRDRMLPSGSHLENDLGRWVQPALCRMDDYSTRSDVT